MAENGGEVPAKRRGGEGRKLSGRRSWPVWMWERFLRNAPTPVEARRRLELARLEAPPGEVARLVAVADARLAVLLEAPADPGPGAPADPGPGAPGGRWWW